MTTLGTAYKASDIAGTAPETNSRPEVLGIKEGGGHIIKVIPLLNMQSDATNKALQFFRFDQFPYKVVYKGETQTWFRPSLELQGKEDPQKKYFTELRNTVKEWEKGGYDKNPQYAAQFNQMKADLDAVKPYSKVALLVVRPNEPKVHVLVTSPTVTDQLFGKSGYGDRAAVESLVDKMRKENAGDPFDLHGTSGWVKVHRTGKVFHEVRYHANAATEMQNVTGANGQVFSVPVPCTAQVHPAILDLGVSSLPDVLAHVNVYPWSEEDVAAYAASGFKTLPPVIAERIAKASQSKNAAPAATPGVPPAMPAVGGTVTTGYVQMAPAMTASAPSTVGLAQTIATVQAPTAPPAPPSMPQMANQGSVTTDLNAFLSQNVPPRAVGQ